MTPRRVAVAAAAAVVASVAALVAVTFVADDPTVAVPAETGRARREAAQPLSAAIRAFDASEIVTAIPRDAIPAIVRPKLVRAPHSAVIETEPVIGVELDGEARAYPIRMLAAHEIVNDEIRGRPIAVTWCPLCHTAVVYDRRVEGRTVTFGVSGKLYRSSLIMYDRETDSLWSHLLGAAVEGPMKGARLTMIPSTFTQWADWRREHTKTLVLEPELGPYGGKAYREYLANVRGGGAGPPLADKRLPRKALVLGVLEPAAKAYAFGDLERLGTITDTIASEQVEVVWDDEAQSAEAFLISGETRKRLSSTPIFWFAWVGFFPGAPLWNEDSG